MTTDAIQLLRDHWSEVPKADEETVRRAFAYATSGTRTRLPRPLRLRGVPPLRLRIALPAAAAICAAAAALVATGTFTGGARQTPRHRVLLNGDQAVDPFWTTYTRNGGALSSVGVNFSLNIANASIQLQVVHSDATSYAEAYAGSTQVVYQTQVATTTPPASSSALSAWSGTLSPSDWSGGCQSGLYQMKWVAVKPGTSFANASSTPGNLEGASEWFSCTGS